MSISKMQFYILQWETTGVHVLPLLTLYRCKELDMIKLFGFKVGDFGANRTA